MTATTNRQHETDGAPEAFEAHPEESVVETPLPFQAEVARRKNTRALIGGLVLVAGVITLLAVAGYMVKQYRAQFAQDRAAKEKSEREKAVTTRQGREFAVEEPAAAEVPPAVPDVPKGLAALPSGPLPSALPAPMPGPLPSGSGALPLPPALPPAKPAPPSMMMDVTSPPADLATKAAAKARMMVGQAQRQEDQTVQAMANAQASGKAPTATAQASAAQLGDRSFVIARGSWIPCILETQLNSTVPGNTSCVVPEDVYSDDGKALLVEKGSRAQGSFGSSLKVGDERIAVQWARIKTTRGVVIDVESPATDGVGNTGAGGHVDTHWMERIGAAVLLSFVEDGIGYASAGRQNPTSAQNGSSSATTVYLPNNTIGSTKRLAEKILDSTINIPPTLYKNRGDRIMIFVNRDLWFDSAFKLVPAS